MLGQAATPLALIALGMGLAEYQRARRLEDQRGDQRASSCCCSRWWCGCWPGCSGLPLLETQVVVLLASIAVGANVYLMSRQFKVLEGPVAGSLVLSTGAGGADDAAGADADDGDGVASARRIRRHRRV